MNKTLFRITSLFFFPQKIYAFLFFLIIFLLFTSGYFLVYYMGGTSQSYVHIFYVPVILSALSYGLKGGLSAGIIALCALGPYMPYITMPYVEQPLSMWLFRGFFFILIGFITGLGSSLFRTFSEVQKERLLTDPLTDLPNLRGIKNIIDAKKTKSNKENLAVILIEIRHLWTIEKAIGPESTQKLLKLIAEKLKNIIGTKATIGYLETGSFVLVTLTACQETNLMDICRTLLGNTFVVDTIPLFVEFYYGGAHATDEDPLLVSTLRKAKIAAAKAVTLRKTFAVYACEDDIHIKRNVRIIHDLNIAVLNDQLSLVYQPKFDLKTNKVIGAEALVRWPHPELGLISPDDFIPVIESTLLINPFTKWVLKAVVNHMVLWQTKGIKLPIAINFSMSNFQDPSFLSYLTTLLQENNIPSNLIEIEVTETAVALNIKEVADILHAMREQGIRIAIDDFGTGQASMQYLCELPIDTIKIDKFFVQDMTTNSASEAIVRSSILLGHALNLLVVAEGIESKVHLSKLQDIGCDIGQGFYLAKPMTFEQLLLFLPNRK